MQRTAYILTFIFVLPCVTFAQQPNSVPQTGPKSLVKILRSNFIQEPLPVPEPQPAIETEPQETASAPVITQPAAPCSPHQLRNGSATSKGQESHPYFRGWLFRRYAGTYEMETKTPYPPTYHGTYTYRPWQPDWTLPPRYYAPPPVIFIEQLPPPDVSP